ncbi:MAG: bifunctional phosphoglucose/phosphomannose isomerase [Rubricoccaceae bacterium]
MPEPLYDPSLDPGGMRAAIRAFPDHLAEGWERGAAAEAYGIDASALNGVVVCGMGGSAIGGDLVRTLVERESPVPFLVNRGYTLPGWVDSRTLVVVSSYSGGTEETLSAYADARQRGAQILVITSGGEAQQRAGEGGDRLIEISGGMQPRAALGYSLGVLLRFAWSNGLLELADDTFEAALSSARARAARHDDDAEGNPARDLSAGWVDRLPVVYTGAGLMEAVGLRWRGQIQENAKHPAVGNVFPELDHNEIMGYEAGPEAIQGRFAVTVLRDADDHGQVTKRFDVTRGLLESDVASWTDLESEGNSRLDRVLHFVQLGDAASFWLAMRKRVDPTPVETIQQLKRTLAA